MTEREAAKFIINNKGRCTDISCSETPCPLSRECKEISELNRRGNYLDWVTAAQAWLDAHPEEVTP
jgi:hypothetical protein